MDGLMDRLMDWIDTYIIDPEGNLRTPVRQNIFFLSKLLDFHAFLITFYLVLG